MTEPRITKFGAYDDVEEACYVILQPDDQSQNHRARKCVGIEVCRYSASSCSYL